MRGRDDVGYRVHRAERVGEVAHRHPRYK
jgi:hypothetical protein